MASAWGSSWGVAWGNSWGSVVTATGLRSGGHGRRRGELTTSKVADWWDRRDALVKRSAQLRQEEQRAAVEASAEVVSRTIETATERQDTSEAVQRQFETMIAAVERAIAGKTAAKVIAAAKQAEEEAIRILEAIEDENAAILLLLA